MGISRILLDTVTIASAASPTDSPNAFFQRFSAESCKLSASASVRPNDACILPCEFSKSLATLTAPAPNAAKGTVNPTDKASPAPFIFSPAACSCSPAFVALSPNRFQMFAAFAASCCCCAKASFTAFNSVSVLVYSLTALFKLAANFSAATEDAPCSATTVS